MKDRSRGSYLRQGCRLLRIVYIELHGVSICRIVAFGEDSYMSQATQIIALWFLRILNTVCQNGGIR